MLNYDNMSGHHCDKRTNAFLDIKGMPYLLAEYLDSREFRQVDRSLIRNEIYIDQSESMRAIVDINIDDIGKNSDGSLRIIGNKTKERELLQMIRDNAELLQHQLDTVKSGVIIRINYQLENHTTHQVIRSMVEDLRITDRTYYMDINPKDVNDNAILVNLASTMVSTVNNFTHGTNPMVLRITNIQLFYEGMKRDNRPHQCGAESTVGYNKTDVPAPRYGGDIDKYVYQSQLQNRQSIGIPGTYNGGSGEYANEPIGIISPPSWTLFNRFYHFDNCWKDIILHFQEINDPVAPRFMIPCGVIQVNRLFTVNPGHRIIFKLSIWKNDLTVVNDTTMIANNLKVPGYDDYPTPSQPTQPSYPPYFPSYYPYPPCPPYPPPHPPHPPHPPCPPPYPPLPPCPPCPPINPDYEELKRVVEELRLTSSIQTTALHELTNTIKVIQERLDRIDPPKPPEPVDPPEEVKLGNTPKLLSSDLDNGLDGGTF